LGRGARRTKEKTMKTDLEGFKITEIYVSDNGNYLFVTFEGNSKDAEIPSLNGKPRVCIPTANIDCRVDMENIEWSAKDGCIRIHGKGPSSLLTKKGTR
jgi:hypothetical protein